LPIFYILTQLPLPDTTEDFWKMIVNERCTSIVVFDTPSASIADKARKPLPCEYAPLRRRSVLSVFFFFVPRMLSFITDCYEHSSSKNINVSVAHLLNYAAKAEGVMSCWPDDRCGTL
jgi:hypothetical protein